MMMQYPRKIQIGFQEGTCPLRCRKCPGFGEHAKRMKEIQRMSLDQSKVLIDEIAQMETVPVIQPHLITEPFANKNLKEIITYSCNKGISFSIITNGILLEAELMEFLIESLGRNSTISFSLDAVTQETYEKVRGNYNLIEIEKKIDFLMQQRGNRGPRIGVNFVYEEDNYAEKDIFLESWKNRVDVVHIGVCLDEKGRIPEAYRKKDVDKGKDACPFLNEVMAIDSDGGVRVCSRDAFGDTYLGNVFNEGILPVWNGEKRKQLLEKQRQNLLQSKDFCKDCEWGYSLYRFDNVTETDEFVIKRADYAMYYNRKEKKEILAV